MEASLESLLVLNSWAVGSESFEVEVKLEYLGKKQERERKKKTLSKMSFVLLFQTILFFWPLEGREVS